MTLELIGNLAIMVGIFGGLWIFIDANVNYTGDEDRQ